MKSLTMLTVPFVNENQALFFNERKDIDGISEN